MIMTKQKTKIFLTALAVLSGIVGSGVISLKTQVLAQSAPFLYWPVPSNKNVACGWGCYSGHVGTDIGVSTNNDTPIYAAASGTVVTVVNNQPFGTNRVTSPASGNHVVIKHDLNGTAYYTYYLHLTNSIQVQVNQQISAGQLLGYGSNSGLTCGTQPVSSGGCMGYAGSYWHLHFQVNKSSGTTTSPVNPYTDNLWVKNTDGSIANPPINSVFYQLELKATPPSGVKQCFDIDGTKIGIIADANMARVGPCRSIQEQQFRQIDDGNGYYRFELKATPPSGVKQCFDIDGTKIGIIANANMARVGPCRPIQEQQFRQINDGNGYYRFELKATPPSGVKQCFDIDGTKIGIIPNANMARVGPCRSIQEQQFKMNPQ
jgi:hypothetical protein